MKTHNYIKAFTLAEVLIALVIIGVIAAITVPSVMQTTQKQEYVAKLKKAHSTLAQSIYKISIKNGYPAGDFSYIEDENFFNLFANEVNADKICGSSVNECFAQITYHLNGSVDFSNYISRNALIALDGTAYDFNVLYCNSAKGLSDEDLSNCIGRFMVDLNGLKKPNTNGKDIFFFAVVNGKGIIPAGSGNNSAYCRKDSYGTDCAAKVLREGKINY